MEQGRVAARVRIVQRQTGDLMAAAVIDALERFTCGIDDRAAGLGFEAAQIQITRLLVGTSRVHLDEFPEIVDALDQERIFFCASAGQQHLLGRYPVDTRVLAVFGADDHPRLAAVCECQAVRIIDGRALTEGKDRFELGQVVLRGEALDLEAIIAGDHALVAAERDTEQPRGVRFIVRAKRYERCRDRYLAIGRRKGDLFTVFALCVGYVAAKRVFDGERAGLIAVCGFRRPFYRVSSVSARRIVRVNFAVRAGFRFLDYCTSVFERNGLFAGDPACFRETGHCHLDRSACFIPVDRYELPRRVDRHSVCWFCICDRSDKACQRDLGIARQVFRRGITRRNARSNRHAAIRFRDRVQLFYNGCLFIISNRKDSVIADTASFYKIR